MKAQEILDELEEDDRIGRVKALSGEIEDATGLDLPHSMAALDDHRSAITRALREEAGYYDEDEDEDEDE